MRTAVQRIRSGEQVRVLTIHQPWASLIAAGVKKFETRSWSTKWRGLLAIHAGIKHYSRLEDLFPLEKLCATHDLGSYHALPMGTLVALVELEACHYMQAVGTHDTYPKDYDEVISRAERELGDFSERRFAWRLSLHGKLSERIEHRGTQGVSILPPTIARTIAGDLEFAWGVRDAQIRN